MFSERGSARPWAERCGPLNQRHAMTPRNRNGRSQASVAQGSVPIGIDSGSRRSNGATCIMTCLGFTRKGASP